MMPHGCKAASGFIAMNDTTNQNTALTPDSAARFATKADRTAAVAAKGAAPGIDELQRLEKAGALVMAARNALRHGRREEARAQLKQAFDITSTDGAALELLGDLFLEEGEQQKAIAIFERGRKYHPDHAAFEEKIALAHIDLEEMKRDALLKELAIKGEVPLASPRAERKPGSVAFLSLLLPGAGQWYNEEPERGAVFLGVSLLLCAAWLIPWRLDWWQLGGMARAWIGAMLLLWFVSHVMAAMDAGRGVRREAEERKRTLGL